MAEFLTESTPFKGRYDHIKETLVDVAPAVIIRPLRPVLPNGRHLLPTDKPFYLKREFLSYHDLTQGAAKRLAEQKRWNTLELLNYNYPPPGWEIREGKSKPHFYPKLSAPSITSPSDGSGVQPNITLSPSPPDNEVILRPSNPTSLKSASSSSPTPPPIQLPAEQSINEADSGLDSEKRLAVRMRGKEGMENPNGLCARCKTKKLKPGETRTCYVFREPGKSNRCDHCAWSHNTARACNLMTNSEKKTQTRKRGDEKIGTRRENKMAMRKENRVVERGSP